MGHRALYSEEKTHYLEIKLPTLFYFQNISFNINYSLETISRRVKAHTPGRAKIPQAPSLLFRLEIATGKHMQVLLLHSLSPVLLISGRRK